MILQGRFTEFWIYDVKSIAMEILCAPYTALISISFRNSLCLERVLKIQAQTVAIPSLFKEKKKP